MRVILPFQDREKDHSGGSCLGQFGGGLRVSGDMQQENPQPWLGQLSNCLHPGIISIYYVFKCHNTLQSMMNLKLSQQKFCTTLQSMMNAKLSLHGF